jgi:hypothetical protein
MVEKLMVDGQTRRAYQQSTTNYQLATKEAA